jgi:spermidine synthase
MYHVIGTGLTVILLYIISYIFYRLEFFSYQFHKKLWNAILAVAFLVTAIAGIFTALQITYKWDLPYIKAILKWHVEFGIGMAFTGLIHFIWHLSYFRRIFERHNHPVNENLRHQLSSDEISLNLFMVGLVSSAVQLLLMREMLNISGGYELITGIFLGSWLLGSAAGSVMAGSSGLTNIRKINLIFSLSPLVSLTMMFILARMFLSSGETPSFLVSLIYTFLVLLPFCLVSGFTFIRLISIAKSGNDFKPGRSFSTETIGGVTAGILISLLTSGILNTYQLLLLIILFSISYVLLFHFIVNKRNEIFMNVLILIISSVIILSAPDKLFRQILLPGIKVKATHDTPYGNITIGEYKGEKSTYYDQRLLVYNYDVTEREENIHYAMLQCQSPEKVILISGSLGSQLHEILKYPVRKITYIERDPALTGYTAGDSLDKRVLIVNGDAFRYLRRNIDKSDVIILSVPPPSTLQLNRYYTTEFFKAVRNNLVEGGVFMCSPGPGNDYFNKESLTLYSSVYNSLCSVFRYVRPVSGNKLYFIASDKDLSVEFCKLTDMKKISNFYVSRDYLSDDLIAKKTAEMTALMDRGTRMNSSSFPVASYHFQAFNLSRYPGEKTPAIIILIVLFAAPLLMIKKGNMLMYFSASALAGFEIIILLTLQVIVGNMYQLSGLVIASLMAGLAAGSRLRSDAMKSFSKLSNVIVLLGLYTLAGIFYNSIVLIRSEIMAIGLIILSVFITSFMTGLIFNRLTDELKTTGEAASVYSADLAGSALGFILITAIAVPAFGIKKSLFLLALLIFTGFLLGTLRNKL